MLMSGNWFAFASFLSKTYRAFFIFCKKIVCEVSKISYREEFIEKIGDIINIKILIFKEEQAAAQSDLNNPSHDESDQIIEREQIILEKTTFLVNQIRSTNRVGC